MKQVTLGGLSRTGEGGGGTGCQDCGNRAKKECPYNRCRACCRSKGFSCQTHVKSTWVPTTYRKSRFNNDTRPQNLKRVRSTNLSTLQGATDFPAEVSTVGTFRCVRLWSMEDHNNASPEEYAYRTSVSIGGHVFKGILYDQGPYDDEDHGNNDGGELRHYGGGENSLGGDNELAVANNPINYNSISLVNPITSTNTTTAHGSAIHPPFSDAGMPNFPHPKSGPRR